MRSRPWVAEVALVVVAIALSLVALRFMFGCSRPTPQVPPDVAAEAAYAGDLLTCVDRAKTLLESKQCEATVNRRWGIVTHHSIDAGREARGTP